MKKNSIKNTRINSEVQRVLAECIRGEVKDPRVPAITSVTAVEVAPDLKTCKVWVSLFTDDEAQEKAALEGLKSAEGFLRHTLSKEVDLRNTPTLTFLPDRSISYGNRMSRIIDEVCKSDEAAREKRKEDENGV